MGTRNITKVIHNGEVKACQYGQWDGYPTYSGVKVLEFVKKGDFDALKGCKLVINDENCTVTGAPITERLQKMELFEFEAGSDSESRNKQILDEFGAEAFLEYVIASRDAGCDILEVIKEPTTLYANSYIYETEKPDWQIEAVNVIDLDREVVDMMWHDNTREFSFKEIETMEIEEEMRKFEEEL